MTDVFIIEALSARSCGEIPNPIFPDALLLVNLGRPNVMCHPFE